MLVNPWNCWTEPTEKEASTKKLQLNKASTKKLQLNNMKQIHFDSKSVVNIFRCKNPKLVYGIRYDRYHNKKIIVSTQHDLIINKQTIWKPPESVSIALGQFINLWRPPNSSISSDVGRSAKWYVFPRIIWQPISSSWLVVKPLIVPATR
jgi:hypothetical protein